MSDQAKSPSLSFREKFIAWWEGYDLAAWLSRGGRDARMESGHAQGPVTPGKHDNRKGKPLWTATRIQVSEKLWGPGFTTPGGQEHITNLVKPLGLNPAMSVLELGAGLGGSTRTMAQQFGAWVTGLEHNPTLAEAGMMRSHKAGLARQAPVQPFDQDKFSWPKRVDAVVSKEAFFTLRNKDNVIDAIEAALKPRGQFLFTDYVTDKTIPRGKDFDSWLAHDEVQPHPWSVDQYVHAMQQRNLDIRITEDISDQQHTLVMAAVQQLVKHLEVVSMDRETKLAVVEEVELWARRIAALGSGLRVYRFYAMKPPDLS